MQGIGVLLQRVCSLVVSGQSIGLGRSGCLGRSGGIVGRHGESHARTHTNTHTHKHHTQPLANRRSHVGACV